MEEQKKSLTNGIHNSSTHDLPQFGIATEPRSAPHIATQLVESDDDPVGQNRGEDSSLDKQEKMLNQENNLKKTENPVSSD